VIDISLSFNYLFIDYLSMLWIEFDCHKSGEATQSFLMHHTSAAVRSGVEILSGGFAVGNCRTFHPPLQKKTVDTLYIEVLNLLVDPASSRRRPSYRQAPYQYISPWN